MSLIMFMSIFMAQNLMAQTVSSYVFSTGTGATLDPMTGATVVGSAANDDTPLAAAAIGFSFSYEGTAFTQFSASPDGFMRLGGTTATAAFTNSITSATNPSKIFPLWDDLALGSAGSG